MHFHQAAFNILVHGKKRWYLMPPAHATFSMEPAFEWIEKLLEKNATADVIYTCDQSAGDVLVVRGKQNPTNQFDLMEIVKIVPRDQVTYDPSIFGGAWTRSWPSTTTWTDLHPLAARSARAAAHATRQIRGVQPTALLRQFP